MASIVTTKAGLRQIRFKLAPGERHARIVRLGRCTMRVAEAFKARVESLVSDKLRNRPNDADLAAWLGGLDEITVAKLRAVGLVDAGVGLQSVTLDALCTRVTETLTGATSTRDFYGSVCRNLKERFGATTPVTAVTHADADGFRAWLIGDQALATATVNRRIKCARTIFRKAVRWRLTAANPFDGVTAGGSTNQARLFYVTPAMIDKVLAACPDAEYRAVLLLARYGALRTPSETFALKWGDIDWEAGRMLIRCRKLAHHGDRFATRSVPLFPELQAALLDLHEVSEVGGSEYVIARLRGTANVATQLRRIVERSGVKVWPRLLQNLRASRETELLRDYDWATVTKWVGNSPSVAAMHYVMSTDLDADFARAAGLNRGAPKSAPSHGDPATPAVATEGGETRNPPGNRESGDPRRSSETAGKTTDCARRAQNTPHNSGEKPHIAEAGAPKSAPRRPETTPEAGAGPAALADLIRDVMRLPLTDAERAEAVRRLLATPPAT